MINKIYKDIEELRTACTNHDLDVSYGMNSNTLSYFNNQWEVFWSVGSDFTSYNDKEITILAKEWGILA